MFDVYVDFRAFQRFVTEELLNAVRVFGFAISLVVFWNRKKRSDMEDYTNKLLDVIEPDQITLRYMNKEPFYEKSPSENSNS